MSEEEKKVIESLKYEYKNMVDNDYVLFPLYKTQANKLINLIDKLQKENYELNSDLKVFKRALTDIEKENEELKEKYENINWYFENQKDNFVHKNKIRTKIKELEEEQKKKKHISNLFGLANTAKYVNINNEREIKVLKELLGE